MSVGNLVLFCVVSLGLAVSPGPDILYVLARSLGQGRRAGLVAAAGFVSGLPVHTVLAALGLSLVFRASPLAFHVVRYAGAGYLFYLAWRAYEAGPAVVQEGGAGERALRGIYVQSLTMNLLNPKVVLFFVVFLPGFVRPSVVPAVVQFLILGMLFSGCALAVFGATACCAGTVGDALRRRPGVGKGLRWVTIVILVLLGLNLLMWTPLRGGGAAPAASSAIAT